MRLSENNRLAIDIVVLFVIFWTAALYFKLQNFGYYDWDLAYFCQGMWQLLNGSLHVSLFDKNFFGNHANFIAVLIAPLYKVFPFPLTLLFLKILSVAAAGWVIFRVAVKEIGEQYALWVLLLFFMYAPNIFGILYEFDMESLAPGILALAYYFYYESRWKPFMVMLVLAVLIKENIPLVVAMFGVHGLLTREDKWKWGVCPLVLGMASFFFIVKAAIPFFAGKPAGSAHPYAFLYRHIGASFTDVFFDFLRQPLLFLKKFLYFQDLFWVYDLVGVLLFLPLLAGGVLLLIAPLFLQHFFSSALPEHQIYFFYAMTMAPFIFLALVRALSWVQKRYPAKMIFVMLLLCLLSVFALKRYWVDFQGCYSPENTRQWNEVRRYLLAMIPPDKPVIATFSFLPYLANRKGLYAFHKVYTTKADRKGRFFKVPDNVRWAILDHSDMFYQLRAEDDKDFVKERIDAFFKEGRWVQVAQQGPLFLFRRD
jgi:uncharacterized membrane protein